MSMLICVDMDECSLDIHMCDSHADCMNTIGDYYCVCNSGYSGDGYHCSGNLILMCISHITCTHITCTHHMYTHHMYTHHIYTHHMYTHHMYTHDMYTHDMYTHHITCTHITCTHIT